MKECKAWISNDGKFRSFMKCQVVEYERENAANMRIDDQLITYRIDDCDSLIKFLSEHEDDARIVMGWDMISF